MATVTVPLQRARRGRRLVLSYWTMPLAAVAAVLVAAVGMLVETLVVATQINDNAGVINQEVASTENHTAAISHLHSVAATASEIDAATSVLAPDAASLIDTVHGIDTTASAIQRNVMAIAAHARDVAGTVDFISLNTSVTAEDAQTIDANLRSSAAAVASIAADINAVRGTAGQLIGRLRLVDDHARSIDSKLGASAPHQLTGPLPGHPGLVPPGVVQTILNDARPASPNPNPSLPVPTPAPLPTPSLPPVPTPSLTPLPTPSLPVPTPSLPVPTPSLPPMPGQTSSAGLPSTPDPALQAALCAFEPVVGC